jgi:hypothetical protein
MRDNSSRRAGVLALGFACACLPHCANDAPPASRPSASHDAAPALPAPRPLEALEAPPDVIAYGGADDVSGAASTLARALGDPEENALAKSFLPDEFVARFALANARGVDATRPVRVLVHERKGVFHVAYVVSLASRDELVGALPPERREGDHGNAFGYQAGGRPLFVNFLGDRVVLSEDAGLFSTHAAFLAGLASAQLPATAAVVVRTDRASTALAPLLGRPLAAATGSSSAGPMPSAVPRASAAALATTPPSAAGAEPETRLVSGLAARLVSGLEDVERALIAVAVEERSARLTVALKPKASSALARALHDRRPRPLALLEKLPPRAAGALAVSLDPDRSDPWTRRLVAWSLQLPLLDADIDGTYAAALDKLWSATAGELAFVIDDDRASQRPRYLGLMTLRDAALARGAWRELGRAYRDPTAVGRLRALGVMVKLTPAAYRRANLEVDTVQAQAVDATGAPAMGRLLDDGDFVDLLNAHTAVGSDLALRAYGSAAQETLTQWLEGKVAGGLHQVAGVAAARKRAAEGCFLFAFARLPKVLGRLPRVAQTPLGKRASELTASDDGMAFSAGVAGGELRLVLDVPSGEVKQLRELLR